MPQTPTVPPLTAQDFDLLAGVVLERSGIRLDADRKADLEKPLGRHLRELGLDSYAQYARLLTAGPCQREEFEALLGIISGPSAAFFDHPEQLADFERIVLPELIRDRREAKRLRIWAPACGGGEEAYTLAMIVHRTLGVRIADWHVEILGTDLSERCLAIATAGVYKSAAVQAMPEVMRLRYFTARKASWVVSQEVRSMVNFERLDLRDRLGARRHGTWDAIVCRHALGSLEDSARREVLGILHDQLADDGTLVVGSSEIIQPTHSALVARPERSLCGYRRR